MYPLVTGKMIDRVGRFASREDKKKNNNSSRLGKNTIEKNQRIFFAFVEAPP